MVAIDTNILIRWLTRDDKILSAKADKLLDSAGSASILLDRIILAEMCYVLKSVYGFDKPGICLNLKALIGDGRFSIPDRSIVELMVNIFESEGPLSPEDSWLLALKKSGKVSKVLTFDKALNKRQ